LEELRELEKAREQGSGGARESEKDKLESNQ
jgi:hypothetical protein